MGGSLNIPLPCHSIFYEWIHNHNQIITHFTKRKYITSAFKNTTVNIYNAYTNSKEPNNLTDKCLPN